MTVLNVSHKTAYVYARPVKFGEHRLGVGVILRSQGDCSRPQHRCADHSGGGGQYRLLT
jgi:hypothetical protein